MNKNLTSEELMDVYINNSPEDATRAFEELYFRYSNRVYVYCLRRLGVKSDAEDALQKVFLKLHESKHLFDNKFKFEQWIFVIARTSVYDLLRKRVRDIKKIEALINSHEVSLPVDEENQLDLQEINSLSDEQKKLLELRFCDYLSFKEISEILNKSEVSIRKMASRMIAKLRNGGAV